MNASSFKFMACSLRWFCIHRSNHAINLSKYQENVTACLPKTKKKLSFLKYVLIVECWLTLTQNPVPADHFTII